MFPIGRIKSAGESKLGQHKNGSNLTVEEPSVIVVVRALAILTAANC